MPSSVVDWLNSCRMNRVQRCRVAQWERVLAKSSAADCDFVTSLMMNRAPQQQQQQQSPQALKHWLPNDNDSKSSARLIRGWTCWQPICCRWSCTRCERPFSRDTRLVALSSSSMRSFSIIDVALSTSLIILGSRWSQISAAVELRQRQTDANVAEDDHCRRHNQRHYRIGVVNWRHKMQVSTGYLHVRPTTVTSAQTSAR